MAKSIEQQIADAERKLAELREKAKESQLHTGQLVDVVIGKGRSAKRIQMKVYEVAVHGKLLLCPADEELPGYLDSANKAIAETAQAMKSGHVDPLADLPTAPAGSVDPLDYN